MGLDFDDFERLFAKPGDAGTIDALRVRFRAALARTAELETALNRIKRRAQNNIDRAHNRAVRKLLDDLELPYTSGAGEQAVVPRDVIVRLREAHTKFVRHADEFGVD